VSLGRTEPDRKILLLNGIVRGEQADIVCNECEATQNVFDLLASGVPLSNFLLNRVTEILGRPTAPGWMSRRYGSSESRHNQGEQAVLKQRTESQLGVLFTAGPGLLGRRCL
jgi:hypothetical protein